MGISNNAILFYGYNFTDLLPWIDDEGESEYDYPEDWLKNLPGYFEGLELIVHCTYEYPEYGLGINEQTGSRGYAEKVSFELNSELVTKMNEFIKKNDLAKFFDETTPNWYIVSMNG